MNFSRISKSCHAFLFFMLITFAMVYQYNMRFLILSCYTVPISFQLLLKCLQNNTIFALTAILYTGMKSSKYDLVSVIGPTACGKTRFAALLAARIGGEIISADSRQVYRKMNLGTGKDYDDYNANGKVIPVHLIDILDPGKKYNVFEYRKDFMVAYNEIRQRNNIPVLCGGTGLYIDAVTKSYMLLSVPPDRVLRKELESKSLEELADILSNLKKLHNKTDIDTKKRAIRAIEIERFYRDHDAKSDVFPDLKNVFFGIRYDRQTIKKRITGRLHARLKNGMIEEVENLLKEGVRPDDLIYYGLEYKYLTLFLTGKINYDVMVDRLNIAIHQFAKRQMTWFRKMEKEGTVIHWLEGTLSMEERLNEALKIAGFI